MNSTLVMDGVKLQMDDDLFDCMWNAIEENIPPDFNRMKKNTTNEKVECEIQRRRFF